MAYCSRHRSATTFAGALIATTAPASTASIGQELVALCRQGRNLDAVTRLYSPASVTIEAAGSPEMPAEQTGLEVVRAKHLWWDEPTR
jgi:hypothetical protein